MKLFLTILIGIIGIFQPLVSFGEEVHDFYFRHYTNKEGLSHNTVYCAWQDRQGFMWFGTDDVLNRFDGYLFRTYRHNSNDSASLSFGSVRFQIPAIMITKQTASIRSPSPTASRFPPSFISSPKTGRKICG